MQGLPLADPNLGGDGFVDILLGVEVCLKAFQGRSVRPPEGSSGPIGFKTKFGYAVAGKITPGDLALVGCHRVEMKTLIQTTPPSTSKEDTKTPTKRKQNR